MFRFEKLEVWQRAVELADDVYAVTRGFPDHERFGLTACAGPQCRSHRTTPKDAAEVPTQISHGSSRSPTAP